MVPRKHKAPNIKRKNDIRKLRRQRIALQIASSDKRTKPFENAGRKQSASGVQADIDAFAFISRKKCLGVLRPV